MPARICQIESSTCRKCGWIVSRTNMRAQSTSKGSPKRCLACSIFVDADVVRPKVHATVHPICCPRSEDSLWALISFLNLEELWRTADSAHCPLMSAPVLPVSHSFVSHLFSNSPLPTLHGADPPTMDPSRPAFYAPPLIRLVGVVSIKPRHLRLNFGKPQVYV
jgi:hypothetical protein